MSTTATPAREPDGTVSHQDYLFSSWDVQLRTFATTCRYKRLNVIVRVVTHASLAFFSRRTNTSLVLHALRAYVLFYNPPTNFYNAHAFYPAVRTGSSNTLFFSFVFFFFFIIFFSCSLASDLRFSLGQTNIRRKLPLYDLDSFLE